MDYQTIENRSRRNPWVGSFLLLWKDKLAFISFIYLVILFTASALSPVLVGDKTMKVDFNSFMLSPSILRGGHIFGTDALGKDLFLNILVASRSSLVISFVVVVASTIIGTLMGLLAGYYGGILDEVIMRLIDLMMAFPSLLLVLVVIFIAGTGTDKVILVLIVTSWTGYARIARAETMRLREFQYVEAARCLGVPDFAIIARHILPNLINVITVLAALGMVGVIMTESGLSFLGMGIQPPDVSWGLLVAQGRNYLTNSWWLAFFPGATIFVTATAFSLLSNWVGVIVAPVHRLRLMATLIKNAAPKLRTPAKKGNYALTTSRND
jgi:peptide/nickel transport system permease protein